MSEPETRTLYEWPDANEVTDAYVQEAIPWCVKHDSMAEDNYMCDVEVGSPTDKNVKPDCVVSTGGPDHKWWKDT